MAAQAPPIGQPEINTLVRLSVGEMVIPSRVEDVDLPDLLLAAPIQVRPPEVGAVLGLHWSSPRGAHDTTVTFLGVQLGPISMWRVHAGGEVTLVQRREFARTAVDEQVSVALIPIQTGITSVRNGELIDISEGGARCLFPTGTVQEDREAELHLDLGNRKIVVVGQVLRVQPRHDGTDEITVVYELDDKLADLIRAFVFSRQRRQRVRAVRR